MNITIGDYDLTATREVLNPEEAMGQFKKMKSEAEQVVLRVESFQQTAAALVEDAAATLNMNILKGEEFLAGVQGFDESSGGQRNLLLQALIQLMSEDLKWFKEEAARLAAMKEFYSKMGQLHL